nr:hypothetical protein [Tanacetum cinerariifolium]
MERLWNEEHKLETSFGVLFLSWCASAKKGEKGVDACPNACKMWKAIERLKQGESINVQDLETNLFW